MTCRNKESRVVVEEYVCTPAHFYKYIVIYTGLGILIQTQVIDYLR